MWLDILLFLYFLPEIIAFGLTFPAVLTLAIVLLTKGNRELKYAKIRGRQQWSSKAMIVTGWVLVGIHVLTIFLQIVYPQIVDRFFISVVSFLRKTFF